MKEELFGEDLESIAGGAVHISASTGIVTFTSVGKGYTIKNGVTAQQVRSFVNNLLDANPGMGEKEFDIFAAKQLRAKGWI